MPARLRRLLPILEWLPAYDRAWLRGDLSAGVTVAVLVVPQGMAYAMLAGLPPVIGLYAAAVPLAVYALFATSRHLAVGPVAMVSLLVHVGASEIAPPGSEGYLPAVLLLAALVGLLQLAMGLLRAGFLVNFVSRAALAGFTTAAALVIFVSQLRHYLGVPLSGHSPLQILEQAARRIGEVRPAPLLLGLASLALLLLLPRIRKGLPAPLLLVVAGTLASILLGLEAHGVQGVGAVPRGLPSFTVPALSLAEAARLLPTALTIAFVGFMESYAVAERIAARERYRIDANRELVALGLANVAASLTSGYPVAGGFSRTAVNHGAGAKSGLASLVTAALCIATLLVLTPLFRHLPTVVLAAIITVAVLGLLEFREGLHLWRLKRADGATFFITFAVTFGVGVEPGIAAGVIVSLLAFVLRAARPHVAELGWLSGDDVFRNVRRYPQAITYPGIAVVRIDASLYFANMGFIEEWLRSRALEHPDLRLLVVDMAGVNDMDAVALGALEELIENLQARGVRVVFAEMKGPVRDLVQRAGWGERFADRIGHASIKQALAREAGVHFP